MTSDTRELGGWFLRLLPFVVMGIVAVLDVVEGPGVGYVPLLALGPAFASLSGGLRRMVVVGTLAVLLCTALALYNGSLGDHQNILTFASIIGVLAASMLATLIRKRNQRELADMRTVAEAAQRVLLRPVPQRIGPVQAAVRYISATARATIGGDLYEVSTTPKGVRLVVGDVQGKGLDAVETAAAVLGAFREAAYDEADLAGVAARLEKRLVRQLTEEQFVTAVLAEMEADDHIILLNHGHPPPLMIRADGRVELVEPPEPAPPLGMSSMAEIRPRESVVRFAPGDQLLFYTDGVIEARDAQGTFYPLIERAGLLQDPDPEAALDKLQADLVRHAASPFHDDAAMLLLRHRSRWHPGDDTYPGDEGTEEPPVR